MKLTKDEARILAGALCDTKYDFVDRIAEDKSDAVKKMQPLMLLECRLDAFGKDKRRVGRRSHDGFNDVLKRFCK
jgi:hypothetical protein